MRLNQLVWVSACALTLGAAPVNAQPAPGISDDVVRIGFIMDMSGPYADYAGMNSVEAAKMAAEDFGGKVLGKPIEIVTADHLNKADIASAKAREWFDTGKVDAILDVPGTGPALAVLQIAKQKNKAVIFNSAAGSRLSNEDCSSVSIHYPLDSYSLARPVVKSLVKQGNDSWFVVALDASFGTDILKDVTAFLKESGGSLAGTVRHPINTSDFSSFLLTAQQSGAKVIAIANAGADTTNSIKTARQFGLFDSGKQRLAALYILIDDIHALGVKDMQGLVLTEAWYWDLNDDTRAWAKRFYERTKRMPNTDHASVYSSMVHYLRAIEKTGSDDVSVVFPQMRKTPINDMFAKGGYIREDGRMVHDMYLFEVKKPSESKGPWDAYNLLATIPGDQAYRPLSESKCPLVAGK